MSKSCKSRSRELRKVLFEGSRSTVLPPLPKKLTIDTKVKREAPAPGTRFKLTPRTPRTPKVEPKESHAEVSEQTPEISPDTVWPGRRRRLTSTHSADPAKAKAWTLQKRHLQQSGLKSNEQILRDSTRDVAYGNLVQLVKSYDFNEIVRLSNEGKPQHEHVNGFQLRQRYTRGVRFLAKEEGRTEDELKESVNKEREKAGLKPLPSGTGRSTISVPDPKRDSTV